MDQWTIGTLLETARGYLREKGMESPRLDAELLLARALGLERIQLYTQYDRPLLKDEVDGYRSLISRRAAHEPVAYIVGRAHFRRLELEVGPAVLVPRPETEEVVEAALALLKRRPAWNAGMAVGATDRREGHQVARGPLVVDVGTGSGAIALSLAAEAGAEVLGIDSSPEALRVAGRNVEALGLQGSVGLRRGDLLEGVVPRTLHLVVSNPPYVESSALASLAPDIRLFEPVLALDGGPDGLAVIRRLVTQAARMLRPGGSLVLEMGEGQAEAVEELARRSGFVLVTVHKDLSGKDRILEATLPGAWCIGPADLNEETIALLAGALDTGAVVGVPTDTVYGLAARWDSRAGVRALFAAKGRSPEQPVAALFPSVEVAERSLPDLEPSAVKVLRALLPGPYTFVVGTAVSRPDMVGAVDSLGVRVPDHPALLDLLGSLDMPLAATSANRTGEPAPGDLAEVDRGVLAHCSVTLADAEGAHAVGAASTVVDLRPLASGSDPIVLREGAVRATTVLGRIAAL